MLSHASLSSSPIAPGLLILSQHAVRPCSASVWSLAEFQSHPTRHGGLLMASAQLQSRYLVSPASASKVHRHAAANSFRRLSPAIPWHCALAPSGNISLVIFQEVSAVLQQFLTENKLNLILRSHEGPDARFKRDDMPPVDQGYALDHQCKSETTLPMSLPVPGSKLHAHCLCLLCSAHPLRNADNYMSAGGTASSILAVCL